MDKWISAHKQSALALLDVADIVSNNEFILVDDLQDFLKTHRVVPVPVTDKMWLSGYRANQKALDNNVKAVFYAMVEAGEVDNGESKNIFDRMRMELKRQSIMLDRLSLSTTDDSAALELHQSMKSIKSLLLSIDSN